MSRFQEILSEAVDEAGLIQAVFFDPLKGVKATKVVARPLLLKGIAHYQIESFVGKQVTHANLLPSDFLNQAFAALGGEYRQAQVFTPLADYHFTVSGSGKVSVKTGPATRVATSVGHDRKKNYLIPEGEPCDFLIRLGVMSKSGQVIASKYHKFRQINRFLELVADVVDGLPTSDELTVVDFGCGKSYLTFALYYYLKVVRGLAVTAIGLDLKQDVIEHCQAIADDLGYAGLNFFVGDIAGFSGLEQVDMVVALHACDTATDDALIKAVRWKAKVILSVPCCQQELFPALKNAELGPMLKYGLVKERLATLATDSLRSLLLEGLGYDVQMVEFIDLEHTGKNVLLRAKVGRAAEAARTSMHEYEAMKAFWGVQPYMDSLLIGLR